MKFNKAVRMNTHILLGIAGASGTGKTYSALRVARGLAGEGRIAFVDTEGGRALHYADQFDFDHLDLTEPFTPARYTQAISLAAKEGYKVLVIDSTSHEHSGEGGILDMQEAELERMAGKNWTKREQCKMAAWVEPKKEHKRFMNKLLHLKMHIIFCYRAEEKLLITKDENNKTIYVPIGWQPICHKGMDYEMTAMIMLKPEEPGIPNFIKLQEQHKGLIKPNRKLDEETGRLLAGWSVGSGSETDKTDKADKVESAQSTETDKNGTTGSPDFDRVLNVIAKAKTQKDIEKIKKRWSEVYFEFTEDQQKTYQNIINKKEKDLSND